MSDEPNIFEDFPRGELTFLFDRRAFWSEIKTRLNVMRSQGRGANAYTLAQLGEWPDEELAEIQPVLVPGCHVSGQDDFVCVQLPGAITPKKLFPIDSPALTVFNLFNGLNPLGEISQLLAESTGWEPQRSFAYARGFFLTLVKAGICVPQY